MNTNELFEAMRTVNPAEEKMVKVDPSPTQLSKGAAAFTEACSMGGFSAKEKREICEAVYRAMVGKPQK